MPIWNILIRWKYLNRQSECSKKRRVILLELFFIGSGPGLAPTYYVLGKGLSKRLVNWRTDGRNICWLDWGVIDCSWDVDDDHFWLKSLSRFDFLSTFLFALFCYRSTFIDGWIRWLQRMDRQKLGSWSLLNRVLCNDRNTNLDNEFAIGLK